MARNGVFLTETQDDYLRGDFTPPNKNAERQLRSQIRERTRDAFTDLALLSREMDSQDRKLLAESDTPSDKGRLEYSNYSPNRGKRIHNLGNDPIRSDNQAHPDPDAPDYDKMSPELQQDVLDLLHYVFSLCEHGNVNPMNAVETAITDYHEQNSNLEWVANLSLKPQKGEANKAREKMKRGEDLSATEVRALLAEGYEFSEPEEQ